MAKGVPSVVRDFFERRRDREYEFHRSALIDAGYLGERVFVLMSPRSVPQAVRATQNAVTTSFPGALVAVEWWFPETNMITVTAPREWLEQIGEAIRQADVSETK